MGGGVLSAFVGYDLQPTLWHLLAYLTFYIFFVVFLGCSSLNLKTTWAGGSVGNIQLSVGILCVNNIFLSFFLCFNFWE